MSDAVEVCVVGAGPAGATLAARLAALGHRVAVIERRRFPRPHIGESLSVGAWPLLDTLGVSERVAQAGFVPTELARVRWQREDEEHVRVPGGLIVDRAGFDSLLLDHARAAGARVIAPARAVRPVRRAAGWKIALGDLDIRARIVADATGRRRLLGGDFDVTAPRTLALHAICRPEPAPGGAQTRIDVLADGWLWGAYLPAGGFRVMAFVDPATLRAAGGDRARLLRRMLAGAPLFADLIGAANGPVRACDATCYAAHTAITATSVRVGEAAFAIDPLSSSGVQTAIGTGLAAAAAVHTLLDRDGGGDGDADAALEFYAAHQAHAVARHAANAAAVYAQHTRHSDAPFWRSRRAIAGTGAGAALAVAPRRAGHTPPLDDLASRAVGLAADAELSETPCIVGDRVQRRRALTHPGLDRPVAFLGDAELAPLLDALLQSPSLAHAMQRWDAVLPAGRARAIAQWLHARDLLAQREAQAACRVSTHASSVRHQPNSQSIRSS